MGLCILCSSSSRASRVSSSHRERLLSTQHTTESEQSSLSTTVDCSSTQPQEGRKSRIALALSLSVLLCSAVCGLFTRQQSNFGRTTAVYLLLCCWLLVLLSSYCIFLYLISQPLVRRSTTLLLPTSREDGIPPLRKVGMSRRRI